MDKNIQTYNDSQIETEKAICLFLADFINRYLPSEESKIWHAHPVWFLDDNPIVGYSKLKGGIRLLFWSGESFEEEKLEKIGKFKSAEMRYTSITEIDTTDLERWLLKAKAIQWDYKNIVKRRGVLEKLLGL